MKNKIAVILFVIVSTIWSCKSTKTTAAIESRISSIYSDFPTSERLLLNPVNEFEVKSSRPKCFVDDSILWVTVPDNNDNFGYCFNINTGEKIAPIANRGKASYEFINLYNVTFLGDSIQFHTDLDVIKTFAKKDIIENKPINERGYCVTPTPDSILTTRRVKLPNGSVLATMDGSKAMTEGVETGLTRKYGSSEFNKRMVSIYNGSEANSYQTIDCKDEKKSNSKTDDIDYILRSAVANADIGLKGNDMAVFAINGQCWLYTLDLNSRRVAGEKVYTKFIAEPGTTYNDLLLRVDNLKCNDKYIFCVVSGFFSKDEREAKQFKTAILVFDWDLKPVKKFDLESSKGTYFLSEDCSVIYLWKETADSISLHKSDISSAK